jgi:hypothetical protein
MILLKIDIHSFTLHKAKGNPPRPVYGNGKAFWLALQSVKMKSRQVHVFCHHRLIKGIKQAQTFLLLIRHAPLHLCQRETDPAVPCGATMRSCVDVPYSTAFVKH